MAPLTDRALEQVGHDHTEFELHASELRFGTKQWSSVGWSDRHRILAGAYGALASYAPSTLPYRGVSSVVCRVFFAVGLVLEGLPSRCVPHDEVVSMSSRMAVAGSLPLSQAWAHPAASDW